MQFRIGLTWGWLFAVLLITNLSAQEAAPPAETAAPAADEAAPAAEPGPQRAEFDRILAEWKKMLAELEALQLKYRTAEDQQKAQIEQQWKQVVAKGDEMEPKLIGAAEKAYVEAPNADKQVTDLLVDVLVAQVQSDYYEEAFRLGKLLMDHQCEDGAAADAAGIAAFAVSEFDTAEKYLQAAKQRELLSDQGGMLLQSIPDYQKAWAKEKQIRDAEAKADDLPRVLLTTSKGDIEIELFENEAPNTVANFISLVKSGFYNGLTFHRVLPGFMAQGGCPTGDGSGGPGYNIPCECYQPDYRRHFRGSLSMAHAGRDTGGSQFFLTFLPTPHLDGKHTVFGRVIKGFDALYKLQRRDPSAPGQPKPDQILEAKVLRDRGHEYQPKKVGEGQ